MEIFYGIEKFKITKAELAGTIILNFAGVKGNTEVFKRSKYWH